MPHRQHVERAAELQAPGLGGEPEAELHQVRQALVAFTLKVVLGGPQRVVAEVVHRLGDVAGGEEDLGEAVVGIAAVVGGGAVEADVVEVDLADVEDVEAFDHGAFPEAVWRTLKELCQLHDTGAKVPPVVWNGCAENAKLIQ